MSTSRKQKPWTKMSLEELREATKEFDKPIPFSATKPLSPALRARVERGQRASLKRAKRKQTKTIAVDVSADLLKRFDKFADAQGKSRSELIERGLRGMLEMVGR
jgi:hypothetical protein